MSDLRSGAIQCQRCNSPVTGYEHRVKFIFEDRERIKAGDYAVLSCGCELLSYDIRVAESLESHPTDLVDTIRKDVILSFNDNGPNTKTWHADLFKEQERDDDCE